MPPVYPCINHISPLLQHVGALAGILRLVVNRPHAFLFMRQRLLYPVRRESRFMQKRARGAPQVVYC